MVSYTCLECAFVFQLMPQFYENCNFSSLVYTTMHILVNLGLRRMVNPPFMY